MNYIGEYNHTLDAKGRVIVPAKFRELLGEKFIVCKGIDRCLVVYAMNEWEKFVANLNQLSNLNKNARDLKRFFMAGASEVECDKQGRILLPETLRKYANLESNIIFSGMGDKAEIWSKESWDDVSTIDDMESIAETLDSMGISI